MLSQHFWQNMAHTDMDFFIQGIARKFNHVHTVEQWAWNVVSHIAGADEKHLGKIKRNLQVMVNESVILGRIKYLQQSRRRISPSRKTGLRTPTVFIAWIIRPGSAPT